MPCCCGRRLPLEDAVAPLPELGPHDVLIKVGACGVCRTDLHVADGELPNPTLPLVLGHEIVGTVVSAGREVERFQAGQRVGVPWLGWTCGECRFCRAGKENLCNHAKFTGYTLDGGYAEFARADARYCFAIRAGYDDAHAAPLLCAGLIGFRSLRRAGDPARVGLYGFGAAAHVIAQVAIHEGREVFAFTRRDDAAGQAFARGLGCAWAGPSDEVSPVPLDAAIIFAPAGSLVPLALRSVVAGGRVVCAGIHMSDIPSFPYSILWRERELVTVANLTRADGDSFFAAAAKARVETTIQRWPLASANQALTALRAGAISGAAVLVP